jgi:spore coat protein U-like protein
MMRAVALALLLVLAPAVAHALNLGTCLMSATDIAFGSFSGTELTVTGLVTITCTGGSGSNTVNLRLTSGSSGSFSPSRTMTSGANTLNYQIYTDSTRASIFGDGSAGTAKPQVTIDFGSPTSPSATAQVSMFAVLPVQALPPSGAYVDTISASIQQQSSASTTFRVTANAPANCTVVADNLNFGAYTQAQLDGTTTLTTTCSPGAPYNVGLNQGMAAGATVTTRKMSGPGASVLTYGLFQDAAHTINWGNTPGADTAPSTGTGAAQMFTVFGRVPASQPASPGNYSDTITVTLFF